MLEEIEGGGLILFKLGKCALGLTLNGHVSVNVVPRANSDFTVNCPPNRRASCLHIYEEAKNIENERVKIRYERKEWKPRSWGYT